MIHLSFLLLSLVLAGLGQKLILVGQKRTAVWGLRRGFQVLGLALPVFVAFFFSLTMLHGVIIPESDHTSDHAAHTEWLVSTIGYFIFLTPVLGALLLGVVRLTWLYVRTYKRTWQAHQGLAELISVPIKVRLWHHSRPFAFNLPSLLPKGKNLVVLSTAMVAELDEEELKAVLWHEYAHLVRRDFWLIWFACWLRDAFLYLPFGRAFFQSLTEEQEFACDEWVARRSGVPTAMALADALLKVWEKALVKVSSPIKPFEAPALASQSTLNLTETRVERLIGIGEGAISLAELPKGIARLKAGGIFGSSLSLWILVLELLHIVMLPLGCAISLGII